MRRYSWHSAGSLGWPFSAKILIFFQKNIEKQLFQTALGNCYGLKLPKCCFYCVIYRGVVLKKWGRLKQDLDKDFLNNLGIHTRTLIHVSKYCHSGSLVLSCDTATRV